MLDEPEVIRQHMEETRSSLAEKLETLEEQVVDKVTETTTAVADTVESVKEAVEETVESVKGTVQESVQAVKNTFDLPRQMNSHPWLFVGASVGVGFLGARLLDRAGAYHRRGASVSDSGSSPESWNGPSAYPTSQAPERYAAAAPRPPEPEKPGWLTTVASQFEPEIARLKSLAIGAAIGLARDAIVPSLPEELRPKVTELANDFTAKLGGEVIRGPLLHPDSGQSA
jgi:ElaB/YqjD/DUF883 family membrane-anchored ribosome-binding protein